MEFLMYKHELSMYNPPICFGPILASLTVSFQKLKCI